MICTVDIGIHNGVVVIESLIQCDLIARINSLRLEYHGLQFFFRDKLETGSRSKTPAAGFVAVVHVAQIKAIQGMTKEYEKVEAV